MKTELLEQLEAYIDGQISREELEQFANANGVNNLEEKINWFRDSREAIEADGLRDQLTDLLPKARNNGARIRQLRAVRTLFAIASSILIIILAVWWLNSDNQSDLYAKYEYVDPGLPVLMSQSDDHLLYDALTYYSEENYTVAAEKLGQIQDQYADSDTLSYYLGASLLYTDKVTTARNALQKVVGMQNSGFKQKAEWLLVLSALKENEKDQAETYLSDILDNPQHEFYSQAEGLQTELSE